MADIRTRFVGDAKSALLAGKQVEQQLDRVDRKAKTTSSSLERMVASIGGKAITGAAVGMGVLAGAVGFTGFKFDALKQQALTAFTVMLGSGEKAKLFLDDLADFAAKTPFEFPDLIRASQRLLSMGFAAKDIKPTLTAVGDAVAAIGGDPAAMDSTIRALGQVQAKGRLMAEEMMQLNEAGTFSWKNLAAAIGVDVPKAMELVSKGAVDSDTFMKAFVTNTEQRLGGMMDKQSHSFNGLLSTIKDTFAQVSGKVMLPFFEDTTDGMQQLVDFTSSPEFTAGVERFAAFMRDEVSPAIKDGIGWLIDHRGQFLEVLRSGADYARGMADAVQGLHRVIAPLVEAVGGWETVAKLAFGVVMLRRIQALTASLVGGSAASGAAAGSGGLLGGLKSLIALGPITIPIALVFTAKVFENEIVDFINRHPWLGFLDNRGNVNPNDLAAVAGLPDWAKQQLAGQGGIQSGSTIKITGPDEGTRGARAPGNLLQPPTTWRGTHVTDGLDWNKGAKTAVDIIATAGTPVGAPEDGVVIRHGSAQGGQALYFQADSGWLYWMGHVDQMAAVGTRLKKGDVIAYISGDHPTPHLHIDKKKTVMAPSAADKAPTGLLAAGALSTGTTGGAKAKPTAGMRAGGRLDAGLGAKAVVDPVAVAVGRLRGNLSGLLADGLISDDEMARIKTRLQGLKGAVVTGVLAAADGANKAGERFNQAWDKFVGLALTAFDKAHAKLRERLKATLTFDGVEVRIGRGDLTPTERLLADRRKAAREKELDDAVASAETAEELRAAEYAREEYYLGLKADAERVVADAAIVAEEAKFDDLTDVRRDAFEKELGDIQGQMAAGRLSYDEGLGKIKKLFADYEVPFDEQSGALGTALQSALVGAFNEIGTAMTLLATAIETLVKRMGGQVDKALEHARAVAAIGVGLGLGGAVSPSGISISGGVGGPGNWTGGIVGYAGGGVIPGVYTPVDSRIARVSPGEMILNQRQQSRLWDIAEGRGGRGGAGDVHFHFNGHVWDRDELIEDVRREFRRLYRENGSIFGAN